MRDAEPLEHRRPPPPAPPAPSDGFVGGPRSIHPATHHAALGAAEIGRTADGLPGSPRSAWRERVATIGAVSGGGLLGANARYLVDTWVIDRWGGAFPWGTRLINVTGSFVLGLYVTLATERFRGRQATRLNVATGLLGTYTTFSTFSYETVRLVQQGEPLGALAYVAASLVAGLVAAVAGMVTARAL